ncbi:Os11g0153100, partial [Oryza sativa Japonica Group]
GGRQRRKRGGGWRQVAAAGGDGAVQRWQRWEAASTAMAALSPPWQRRAAASAACGGRPEVPSLRQIQREEGLRSRATTKCAGRLGAVPAAAPRRARPQARRPRQALPPPHVACNPTCLLLPFVCQQIHTPSFYKMFDTVNFFK